MLIHQLICCALLFLVSANSDSDNRDKRTIGSWLSSIGDIFGYDVHRRPSFAPAAPAISAPIVVVPAAPAQILAASGPILAQQQATPVAPPKAVGGAVAPAPAAAPAGPAQLLQEAVRKTFSINFNWDKNVQTLPPPGKSAPILIPVAVPAAVPAPAQAPASAPGAPPPHPGRVGAPGKPPSKVQLLRDYDYEDGNQEEKANQPERYKIELPDDTNNNANSEKREINYDQLHSKKMFHDGFNNFWETSPLTVSHGYKYLAPHPRPQENFQQENFQDDVANHKYEEYDLKPKHHNRIRSLTTPDTKFINAHSVNVKETLPIILDAHGILNDTQTGDSEVHQHLLEYYRKKFAAEAARLPNTSTVNTNTPYYEVIKPHQHLFSFDKLRKIIETGKNNYFKNENLRNPELKERSIEENQTDAGLPEIEQNKNVNEDNDGEKEIDELAETDKTIESREDRNERTGYLQNIEKSINHEILAKQHTNHQKLEDIKDDFVLPQNDKLVIEQQLQNENSNNPIEIEDVEENFDHEILPHLDVDNKDLAAQKVETNKEKINKKTNDDQELEKVDNKEQEETETEDDTIKAQDLTQHDKQFENMQQEFLDRQKHYEQYDDDDDSKNENDDKELKFEDIHGNDFGIFTEIEFQKLKKSSDKLNDEAFEAHERSPEYLYYGDKEQEEKGPFRIYYEYDDDSHSEEKLPYYTGDIESYVKQEFQRDKNQLKENTDKNLANIYRTVEEDDEHENVEDDEVAKNEETTKWEVKEPVKSSKIKPETIKNVTTFQDTPTYFGDHIKASMGFDHSFQRNYPATKEKQAATQNALVVHPLYSGIVAAEALQELHKSNKPLTIPFDFDYSASEVKENEAEYVDNQPAASEYRYESYYVPDSYTAELSYTVAEPAPVDYGKLEKEDFKDDEKLSKNAIVFNVESGKKLATLTINGKTYQI